ncbi:LysM peptidoglycan-binding domain-containing protein [Cellulomonas triticagri]|uniref:LysM peptidoglycan-binding domain-containing protein n=1 Tax=Cellulomonas triticagri TaxID=2483352 RepID=A0A3M2JD68_9CELL|nr:LysM peptidoglycan-binding domain-containing protein [Cellulomonas triticagri]RMI08915.1 LysM peptidoglycan-binding domain-containing protein [Cellulomonas triticagri]
MSAIAVQPRISVTRPRATVGQRPGAAVSSRVAGRGSHPGVAVVTRPLAVADRPVVTRPAVTRSAAPQAGTSRPAPLRLTRRGRAVVVLLGLLLAVAGVMGGRAVADGPERALEVVSHPVASGETLWQIASDIAAPGEDVRDVVLALQDLNGMSSASLQAGEVILLPAGD